MEQTAMSSAAWVNLSGWVACMITIIVQVAYYNRFFGKIDANLETVMKTSDKAHTRIDVIERTIKPQARPCKDLVDLQTDIVQQLATITANLKNLTKSVDAIQDKINGNKR